MRINRATIILIFMLLFMASMPARAQKGRVRSPKRTPSAADVAARATASVVSALTIGLRGRPVVSGSAFFIDSRTLLTNFHLVKDAKYILVSPIGDEDNQVEATLQYTDAKRDLATLKVVGISGKPLKGTDVKHRVGDKVYVIGNPEGFSGTFSEGLISGFREIDGVNYIQMTAPISHGSSGGPVLDANGAVVGIATAFVENAQNLNLAVELDFYGVILLQLAARSPKDK
jgi:S1-C subfamily serine protease